MSTLRKVSFPTLMIVLSVVFFSASTSTLSAQEPAPTTAPEPIVYEDIPFPDLPYPSRWIEVNGQKIHYLEGGDPAGSPVLFLHGNPTWSYLWRDIMPALEEDARVIAPDLIGMGRSDRPDIAYTTADHQAYLNGFIEEMGLENITLVVHDWGSFLGFSYAANNPDNVRAIVFMESMIPPVVGTPLDDLPGPIAEFFSTMRTEGVGEELLLNQNFFVEEALGAGAQLDEETLDAYRAPFPTPADRLPILMFPREVPFGEEPEGSAAAYAEYTAWLTTTDTPMLMFHVTPGVLIPEPGVDWARENIDNLTTIELGPGGHYVQEAYPAEIGQGISAWYSTLGQ